MAAASAVWVKMPPPPGSMFITLSRISETFLADTSVRGTTRWATVSTASTVTLSPGASSEIASAAPRLAMSILLLPPGTFIPIDPLRSSTTAMSTLGRRSSSRRSIATGSNFSSLLRK